MDFFVLTLLITITYRTNAMTIDCNQAFMSDSLDCDLRPLPDALHAFERARSDACKSEIKKYACYYECTKNAEQNDKNFKHEILQSQCHLKNTDSSMITRIYLADLLDQQFCVDIGLSYLMVDFLPHINSSELCSAICLTYYGYKAYGFSSHIVDLPRCVCFRNMSSKFDFYQHNSQKRMGFNAYYKYDLYYDVYSTQYFGK